MAGMVNQYFELASNSNTGESLAVPNIVEYKNLYRIISIIYRIRCFKGALQSELQWSVWSVTSRIKNCAKEIASSLVTLF